MSDAEIDALFDTLDASGMAEMIRAGAVAPDAFVKAHRARINSSKAIETAPLNAIVHRIDEGDAPQDPATLKNGAFAGVPLLLKNTGVAVDGAPLSLGSRLFADQVSAADNTLAARYRAAGFVFTGRTNTPELALSFTTESALHGPARNPWDLTRSPGGSSGGAAAAVAAGLAPVAQSSDGAGSTRVPAAHCGVFGFKPTRMRNPVGPAQAEGIAGMSTPHAVTRSVRDCARMLDVSAGPDLGDPYAAPAPAGPFADALERPPKRLRVALALDAPEGIAMDDACAEAARDAARLCSDLGHQVEEAAPDYDNAALKRAWRVIAAVSTARSVDAAGAARGLEAPDALLEPVNAEWAEEGRRTSGTAYLGAVRTLHGTARAMGRFFARHDVLLSPTTAEIAPPLGALAGAGVSLDAFYDRFWAHAPLTAVFNASGCPAMSVPLFWTEAGLPVGAQFGAGFGNDALLLALAAELEAARPWFGRRPPRRF